MQTAIPPYVHFNYRIDLRHQATTFGHASKSVDDSAEGRTNQESFDLQQTESRLADNVRRTINRTAVSRSSKRIFFLDDAGCASMLRNYNDTVMPWVGPELALRYEQEEKGMLKSDMCRLAQLHHHGGYYFDNDIFVLTDMSEHIKPQTTFATVLSTNEGCVNNFCPPGASFFQAFLAASPRHPLLALALRKHAVFYSKRHKDQVRATGSQWSDSSDTKDALGNVGTVLLHEAALDWAGYPVWELAKAGEQVRHADGHASQLFTETSARELSFSIVEARQTLTNDMARLMERGYGESQPCDMIVTNSRSDPLMLSRAFGRVFWSYLGYSPVVDCLPGTPTGYTPNVLNILPFESSLGSQWKSTMVALLATPGPCVGWRQTGLCDPHGPRHPKEDKSCTHVIPSGASGFCDCGRGVLANAVECEHTPFTCADACTTHGPDPATPGPCAGWRQTKACDPHGQHEAGSDKNCTEVIPIGASGFCDCGRGVLAGQVACVHAPFTCAVKCEKALRLHASESIPIQDAQPSARAFFEKNWPASYYDV